VSIAAISISIAFYVAGAIGSWGLVGLGRSLARAEDAEKDRREIVELGWKWPVGITFVGLLWPLAMPLALAAVFWRKAVRP
jgi:hypothetical protein